MDVRMKLKIEQEEYSGLLKLAHSEMRNPEDQLRYILRQQPIPLGLLLRDEMTMRDTSISAQTSRKDVKSMTELTKETKLTEIDQKERSRVLGLVYAYILSWPTREQKAEPSGETVGESIGGLLPEWSSGSEHEPQSNIENEERSSK